MYFRISHLLIPKGWKLIFSLFFLLLFVAFPAAEMLSHNEGNLLLPLLRFGYYTMPFMLYLFLLVLIFDIFLLFNLLFKWLPSGFLKSTAFRRRGLIIAVIGPALIVIYGIFNFNYIRVSDYTIEVPARSSKLQSLSVAFISDFHIGDLTRVKFIEQFIAKMKSIDPDIIYLAGIYWKVIVTISELHISNHFLDNFRHTMVSMVYLAIMNIMEEEVVATFIEMRA